MFQRLFLSIPLLLSGLSISAQSEIHDYADVLSSTKPVVDFGLLNEVDGPKTVRFYVKNVSERPTALLKVRPTCGCTAADFDKEEFAPGDSAWIDLTYDPTRRPGRFEKGVRIYPTEGNMIRVNISGVVLASPETIEMMYPVDAGLLHLSEQTLMTLYPLDVDERILYLDVYNAGEHPVWVRLLSDYDAISTQPFPSPVIPGEKGMIGIYLDPLKEPRTGSLDYRLPLLMTEDGSSALDTPGECRQFEIRLLSNKP